MSHFIVSDIDLTLLNESGEIVPRNRRALEQAQAQGATVALATARSYIGALPVHEALGLRTPLIANNGTTVYTPGGELLMAQTIPATTAEQVWERFRASPHHWSIRVGDVAHLHPNFDTRRAPFNDLRYYQPAGEESFGEILGDFDNIVSMSLFGFDLEPFYYENDWLELGLTPSYYAPSHYDPREAMTVIANTTSKGEAVRWLQAHLGLTNLPLLAIGDSPADATMFPYGIGVAPANAAPEALTAAAWVGPHCNEGVVGAAIERYVLAKPEVRT